MAELGRLDVFRARDDLYLGPPGADGRVLVLDQAGGQYAQVPSSGAALLLDLAQREWGLTRAEAETQHPHANLDRMVGLGLIDRWPAEGLPPERRLAAEFVVQNIAARSRLKVVGWKAVRSLLDPDPPNATNSRPLLADRLEIAANLGFSIPGTSRLCTVVALSFVAMLRRRGYPATIAICSDGDQVDPHAYALLRGHRVDPSDDQLEAPILRRCGTPCVSG